MFLQVKNSFVLKYHNLTQLISRFACLYLKESKCSKWQESNFTNNLTLNINYIISRLLEYIDVLDVWMRLLKMYSLLASVSRLQLVTSRV